MPITPKIINLTQTNPSLKPKIMTTNLNPNDSGGVFGVVDRWNIERTPSSFIFFFSVMPHLPHVACEQDDTTGREGVY